MNEKNTKSGVNKLDLSAIGITELTPVCLNFPILMLSFGYCAHIKMFNLVTRLLVIKK